MLNIVSVQGSANIVADHFMNSLWPVVNLHEVIPH